jgi:hypothetical protein
VRVYKSCATEISGIFVVFLVLRWKNSGIVLKMQLYRKKLFVGDFVTEDLRFLKPELPIYSIRPQGLHLISSVTCSF